jgi:hypothetical protein
VHTVNATEKGFCPTCLHREGVVAIEEKKMWPPPATPPLKIVQLITVATGNDWAPEQLYCLCDDGTAWVRNGERQWVSLEGPLP